MVKQIRRINLYGGPSVGKSTQSARLFADLKDIAKQDDNYFQVELVREYIKEKCWEGIKPQGFDQNFIFAEQQRREEILLRNGVDLIVTDCPLPLMITYSKLYGVPTENAIREMALAHEEVYPGLHILLQRSGTYDPKGRYQDESEAKDLDLCIADTVRSLFGDVPVAQDYGQLLSLVKNKLGLVTYR